MAANGSRAGSVTSDLGRVKRSATSESAPRGPSGEVTPSSGVPLDSASAGDHNEGSAHAEHFPSSRSEADVDMGLQPETDDDIDALMGDALAKVPPPPTVSTGPLGMKRKRPAEVGRGDPPVTPPSKRMAKTMDRVQNFEKGDVSTHDHIIAHILCDRLTPHATGLRDLLIGKRRS
jgi:hypothetical protein